MRVVVIHKSAEETYVHDIIFAQVFRRERLECVVRDEVYILRTPGLRRILASSSGHILDI